jgi:hypothetical protein
MSRLRFTNRLGPKKKEQKMSDLLDDLSGEIANARQLPLDEQPAAFEVIRQKLEAMIADSRPQDAE